MIVENNFLVTVKFEGEQQELKLFEPENDVLEEIEAIFDNHDPNDSSTDESDDDVIFIDNGEPLPKPVNYTMEMLMKHIEDPISGNLAFSERVSIEQLQRFCSIFLV